MRPFIHTFAILFIPVSLIIAVLFTFYFTFEYSFTQAMSLGVLYGVFSGIFITIILSFLIILLRLNKESILNKLNMRQKEKDTQEDEALVNIESPIDPDITKPDISKKVNKGMDHKLMLLMNKELTFGIILALVKKQVSRSITTYDINNGSIKIKIHGEIISIAITPLTKHTSQIVINGMNNSKYIQSIVSSLKEKEDSFLQY
jgi:uncharacterized membrane protein